MPTLTSTAIDWFRHKVNPNQYLLIDIKKTGCNGYSYQTSVLDVLPDGFRLAEIDGLQVTYDPKHGEILKDLTVDHRRVGLVSQLVYTNPQETSRCGCGASFQI